MRAMEDNLFTRVSTSFLSREQSERCRGRIWDLALGIKTEEWTETQVNVFSFQDAGKNAQESLCAIQIAFDITVNCELIIKPLLFCSKNTAVVFKEKHKGWKV